MAELKMFTVGCILISASLQVFAAGPLITGDTKLGNECNEDVSRWQTIKDFITACCEVFYNYQNPDLPRTSSRKQTTLSAEELSKLIAEGKFGTAQPRDMMIKRMRSCLEIRDKNPEELRKTQSAPASMRSSAVASSIAAASRGATQRNLSKRTTR